MLNLIANSVELTRAALAEALTLLCGDRVVHEGKRPAARPPQRPR